MAQAITREYAIQQVNRRGGRLFGTSGGLNVVSSESVDGIVGSYVQPAGVPQLYAYNESAAGLNKFTTWGPSRSDRKAALDKTALAQILDARPLGIQPPCFMLAIQGSNTPLAFYLSGNQFIQLPMTNVPPYLPAYERQYYDGIGVLTGQTYYRSKLVNAAANSIPNDYMVCSGNQVWVNRNNSANWRRANSLYDYYNGNYTSPNIGAPPNGWIYIWSPFGFWLGYYAGIVDSSAEGNFINHNCYAGTSFTNWAIRDWVRDTSSVLHSNYYFMPITRNSGPCLIFGIPVDTLDAVFGIYDSRRQFYAFSGTGPVYSRAHKIGTGYKACECSYPDGRHWVIAIDDNFPGTRFTAYYSGEIMNYSLSHFYTLPGIWYNDIRSFSACRLNDGILLVIQRYGQILLVYLRDIGTSFSQLINFTVSANARVEPIISGDYWTGLPSYN